MKVSLRTFVRTRAGGRCEYCRLHENDLPLYPFHLEHIIAKKHHGPNDLGNLAIQPILPLPTDLRKLLILASLFPPH